MTPRRVDQPLMCVGCKVRPVAPGARQYCHKACRMAARNRRYFAKHGRKSTPPSREQKLRPRGRVCRHCGARDTEVPFVGAEVCDACEIAKRRHDLCRRCRQPSGKHGCPRCDAEGLAVLITDGQRERTIKRVPHRGRIKVADRYYMVHGWPVVVVLAPRAYAHTRC